MTLVRCDFRVGKGGVRAGGGEPGGAPRSGSTARAAGCRAGRAGEPDGSGRAPRSSRRRAGGPRGGGCAPAAAGCRRPPGRCPPGLGHCALLGQSRPERARARGSLFPRALCRELPPSRRGSASATPRCLPQRTRQGPRRCGRDSRNPPETPARGSRQTRPAGPALQAWGLSRPQRRPAGECETGCTAYRCQRDHCPRATRRGRRGELAKGCSTG